jgi:hypothetical protein
VGQWGIRPSNYALLSRSACMFMFIASRLSGRNSVESAVAVPFPVAHASASSSADIAVATPLSEPHASAISSVDIAGAFPLPGPHASASSSAENYTAVPLPGKSGKASSSGVVAIVEAPLRYEGAKAINSGAVAIVDAINLDRSYALAIHQILRYITHFIRVLGVCVYVYVCIQGRVVAFKLLQRLSDMLAIVKEQPT